MSGPPTEPAGERDRPVGDVPPEPSSPTKITGASWRYIVGRAAREFLADHCTDRAAGLTYHAVLALFPAAIALMSVVGLFGARGASVSTVTGILSDAGAGSVSKTIRPTLETLSQSSGAGLALILGFLGAWWAASGYVDAFGRSLNVIYGVDEGRPIWKRRPAMLLVTLVLIVLVAAVLLALIVSGPVATSIGKSLGLGSTVTLVWEIAKWPVLLIIVIGIVAMLYYATPNLKQPKFRWLSVGATVAIVMWIAASVGFAFYVANFAHYEKTYGALGGVIVFLLWLWITNLALLFGGEIDAELERGRELQAGIPAEEEIRLPLRNTQAIASRERKYQRDLERGRELRASAGKSDDDRGGAVAAGAATPRAPMT